MPHTLDSVLVIEGLRLARRHHIFRILRSMVPMEIETRFREKSEALCLRTKSNECFRAQAFLKIHAATVEGNRFREGQPGTILLGREVDQLPCSSRVVVSVQLVVQKARPVFRCQA